MRISSSRGGNGAARFEETVVFLRVLLPDVPAGNANGIVTHVRRQPLLNMRANPHAKLAWLRSKIIMNKFALSRSELGHRNV